VNEPGAAGIRLDKWLWAARFFKTRGLASEAIDGGHVHLNGTRPKPAKTVRIGDRLTIRKAGDEFELVVRLLSDKRGPAAVAQTLYEETEASRAGRAARAEERSLHADHGPRPEKRPDKRDRRRIIRFSGRS
jgi:ribosome-associated heat shock protein Hsp15